MNPTPQIPLNAPFNEAQRLWLNGYIAGIISQSATQERRSSQESEKKKTKKRIPIVFASPSQQSITS